MNKIYISRKYLEKLEEKILHLKETEFPQNKENMRNSIETGGGMHDNASYEYLAIQERMILSRIEDLEAQLKNAIIIDSCQIDTSAVHIGTKIVIKELKNQKESIVVICGAYESDPDSNKVSYLSPFGKEFIGKKVGDIVEVKVPIGQSAYKILGISVADEFFES